MLLEPSKRNIEAECEYAHQRVGGLITFAFGIKEGKPGEGERIFCIQVYPQVADLIPLHQLLIESVSQLDIPDFRIRIIFEPEIRKAGNV